METEDRDVNDNRIQFEGKTNARVEINGTRKELKFLVTTKKTNPLLGLDWMKKLRITLETGKTVPQVHQVKEDPDVTTLKTKFKKPFNENHTANRLEVKKKTIKRRRKINTAEKKSHTEPFATIG